MQTVDRIVEVLEEVGIDHVFGIPGGDTGRIFKALYHKQDKIKVVVARDEQTAACRCRKGPMEHDARFSSPPWADRYPDVQPLPPYGSRLINPWIANRIHQSFANHSR